MKQNFTLVEISCNTVYKYFQNQFELLLKEILANHLNVNLTNLKSFEELIYSIPSDMFLFEIYTNVYYYINSNDIKSHTNDLMEILIFLKKYEKGLPQKR